MAYQRATTISRTRGTAHELLEHGLVGRARDFCGKSGYCSTRRLRVIANYRIQITTNLFDDLKIEPVLERCRLSEAIWLYKICSTEPPKIAKPIKSLILFTNQGESIGL